jgi:multidrug efflux pump subunit AcrB
MLALMQTLPELKDVSSDQQSNGGAVNLTIDRDAAARFGITPTAIDTAIYEQIGQDEVAQYYTQQNSYHIVVEAPPALQASPDLFNSVFILSPITGKTVPLSLFVKVNPNATGSLTVNHQGEYPAATLAFNLAPGVALSQATNAVLAAREKLGSPITLRSCAAAFNASRAPTPADGRVERMVMG